MTVKRYDTLPYDTPVKDGDSTLVRKFIKEAEKPYRITHNLGRKPLKITIVEADTFVLHSVLDKDNDSATLSFFEHKTNLVLRFE